MRSFLGIDGKKQLKKTNSGHIIQLGFETERPVDKRLRAYTKFVGDYPDYDVDVKLCAFASSEMQEAAKVYESQGLVEGREYV